MARRQFCSFSLKVNVLGSQKFDCQIELKHVSFLCKFVVFPPSVLTALEGAKVAQGQIKFDQFQVIDFVYFEKILS